MYCPGAKCDPYSVNMLMFINILSCCACVYVCVCMCVCVYVCVRACVCVPVCVHALSTYREYLLTTVSCVLMFLPPQSSIPTVPGDFFELSSIKRLGTPSLP